MVILNSIFPLFCLIALGCLLNRFNVTTGAFFATSDRLVYYIFFPVMLFWKIRRATTDGGESINLCMAVIASILVVYLLSLGAIGLFGISSFQAGSFSQACYRFNTYIGMAIIITTLGEPGVRYFGILIGFAIPFVNVLAVSTLVWHSGKQGSPGDTAHYLLRTLISNPLILGCVAGILFAKFKLSFPVFLDNTFRMMTSVTLPLALLSIGGSLRLVGLRQKAVISFAAALLKIVILPLIGFLFLKLFSVSGVPFKVGMIFFALPTSTAIYVLSAQLSSDTELASAAIMVSTVFSFIPLSVVLLL
ncbi:MAG: AEC family transporter [Desulfobacterium sp.]|jgi:predicted permease|nr:AEC family transporter [Desulfobacterium sp.]